MIFAGALLNLALAGSRVQAQGTDVTAHVLVRENAGPGATQHKITPGAKNVVVWLTPLQPDLHPAFIGHPGPFRLVQKDKLFAPHLLVVPTGSSVDFPN